VAVVYVADGRRGTEIDRVVGLAKDRGISVEARPRSLIEDLSGRGSSHQGIAAVVGGFRYASLEDMLGRATAAREPPLLVLLDGVTDPHNLGAVVRSAEVLGAHGVILPERAAAPVSGAAVKASAGATERVLIARVPRLLGTIDELRSRGIRVLGSSAEEGQPIDTVELTGPIAFILGSEGRGTRQAVARRCDGLVRVPQRGRVASLNVSVAGALLLYEAMRQRQGPTV
jgi:23S rRNA (guanosine2251-2'-O)-methyltransferase